MVDLFLKKLNLLEYFPDIDRELVELSMSYSSDVSDLFSRLERR